MKKYKLTVGGFFLSLVLWLVIISFDLDFFGGLSGFFAKLDRYEIDELIFPIILLVTCFHMDQFKIQRQNQVEAEKSKIYKAMLAANEHILNNFLHEMHVFKITAEEINDFPDDVIWLYDKIIENTKQQIDDLSCIEKIDAEAINEAIKKGLSLDSTPVN